MTPRTGSGADPGERDEWIEIIDLEVATRIGVAEQERRAPQKLWLDLSFQVGTPFDRLEDDLQRTVDYARVATAVTEWSGQQECRLVETFAIRIAALLRENFPVRNVRVVVRKVVLPNARCVQVRTGG